MFLIRIYYITVIASSLLYLTLKLPSPVLGGFNLWDISLSSFVISLFISLFPFICLEMFFFNTKKILKKKKVYRLSIKLKLFLHSYIFILFILILYFTVVLYALDLRDSNLQSRILKSKLMMVLYPLFGFSIYICFIYARSFITRYYLTLICAVTSLSIAFIEISRDYLLVLIPLTFGIIINFKLRYTLYLFLLFSLCIFCLYSDFVGRTYGNFAWIISDSIFYISGYNILFLAQLIDCSFISSFSLRSFLLNLQPLPVSIIDENHVYQLYDPVRPVSGVYQLYHLNFLFMITYIVCSIYIFKAYVIKYSKNFLFLNFLFLIYYISLFQYNIRQSIRILHFIILLYIILYFIEQFNSIYRNRCQKLAA